MTNSDTRYVFITKDKVQEDRLHGQPGHTLCFYHEL